MRSKFIFFFVSPSRRYCCDCFSSAIEDEDDEDEEDDDEDEDDEEEEEVEALAVGNRLTPSLTLP